MIRSKLALAALAVGLFVTAAPAADLPSYRTPAYAPPASYNWTGWYVGGTMGYGIANFGSTNTDLFGLGVTDPSARAAGLVGGFTTGYNWQTGPAVLGLEGDANWSSMNGSGRNSTTLFGFFPFDMTTQASINSFATLRGRGGIVLGDWLFYGTGGVAYVNATVKTTALFFGSPALLSEETRQKMGWTVGGGVEARISGNWTAKVEYLHIDAGTIKRTINVGPGPETLGTSIRADIVRIGANYKF